jgi:hypothetical protein
VIIRAAGSQRSARLIAMVEAESKTPGDVVVDAIGEHESLTLNIHLHGLSFRFQIDHESILRRQMNKENSIYSHITIRIYRTVEEVYATPTRGQNRNFNAPSTGLNCKSACVKQRPLFRQALNMVDDPMALTEQRRSQVALCRYPSWPFTNDCFQQP